MLLIFYSLIFPKRRIYSVVIYLYRVIAATAYGKNFREINQTTNSLQRSIMKFLGTIIITSNGL